MCFLSHKLKERAQPRRHGFRLRWSRLVATWSSLSDGVGGIACKADRSLIHTTQTLRNSLDDNTSSYFFKRQHRQQWQREERAQLRMSQSDIQHRQLRLLLRQKSCLCCCCCYYISVVFQKPQAKTASKKNSSTSLKRQPAFRLVKVVFVVVNRQHRVQNQTVVPVVSVVVKREGE